MLPHTGAHLRQGRGGSQPYFIHMGAGTIVMGVYGGICVGFDGHFFKLFIPRKNGFDLHAMFGTRFDFRFSMLFFGFWCVDF